MVQNTGPSRFLPSNKGLHRFSDMNDAVKAISTVALGNYEMNSDGAFVSGEDSLTHIRFVSHFWRRPVGPQRSPFLSLSTWVMTFSSSDSPSWIRAAALS